MNIKFIGLFIIILFSCQVEQVFKVNIRNYESGVYQISGIITDLSGDPISGVLVSLSGDNEKRVFTNENGEYIIDNLAEGNYNISAYREGKVIYPQSMTSLIDLSASKTDYDFLLINRSFSERVISVSEIQGTGHKSSYENLRVTNVIGVVIGTEITSDPKTYEDIIRNVFIQSPFDDLDNRTSEGVKVVTSIDFNCSVGDLIIIKEGYVLEVDYTTDEPYKTYDSATRTNLSVGATSIEILSSGNQLPTPVIIGKNGRNVPHEIVGNNYYGLINDDYWVLEPDYNAIDLYESLEFMRVQIDKPVITGPTSYSEIFVAIDNGEHITNRSVRGGALVSSYNDHVTTVINISKLTATISSTLKVGMSSEGSIVGILDYSKGSYTVRATEMPAFTGVLSSESTTLIGDADKLTIASFNVENFTIYGYDPAVNNNLRKKFWGIAGIIANNLEAPDIVGLVEIQDDSGSMDDGVITSDATLTELCSKINEFAGLGHNYTFCYVSPEYNYDGGEPGSNIRCAFIYNSERVDFVSKEGGGEDEGVQVIRENGEVTLSSNPGQIEPLSDSFLSTRKSLVAEFIFNGEKIFVAINHLSSKRGDAPEYGIYQPPFRGSETKRWGQAAVLNDFFSKIISMDSEAKVVLLGDYNDYQYSKTLTILKGDILYSLIDKLPINERYTYIHNGISQVLDHILISNGLNNNNPEFDVVRVNCEFNFSSSSNSPFSDHEPLIARFTF